jgi:hypothetical protein
VPPTEISRLSPETPLVLLPVRVETRWFDTERADQLELRVRIFPDEIHITELAAPDEEERAELAIYLATRERHGDDAEATGAAWARLVERVGPGRAAWLARGAEPIAPAPVLPERWHLIVRGPGFRAVASGEPIPADLATAPVDGDEPGAPDRPALGRALDWVVDFDAARAAGMAMALRVPRTEAERLDDLIVVGARGDDDSALAALLGRHAAGTGASLLPTGTPTNHGEAGVTGAATDAAPLGTTPDPTGDAARLLRGLGIEPAAGQDLISPPARRHALQRDLHEVLWPATWGHFLEVMLKRPEAERARARSLFLDHVRPLGAYPSVRVGAQPYGVLPSTSLAHWPDAEPGGELADFLHRLLARWLPATAKVPRVGDSDDLDRDLIAILRRAPTARALALRAALPRETAVTRDGGILGRVLTARAEAMKRAIAQAVRALALAELGLDLSNAPIFDLIFDDDPLRITAPLVAPASANRGAPLEPNYLQALAAASSDDLTAHRIAGAEPRTLLYLLARHATLRGRLRRADVVLGTAIELRDEHRVMRREEIEPVAIRLRRAGTAILRNPVLSSHRAALARLAAAPVGELERALPAALDTTSHRLDAWVTALASERLDHLRADRPTGAHVGGWAWLEAPRPGGAAPASTGFVHAPSLAQARTAAVLRAGHDAGADDSLALDLSSERVRTARHILDGVRSGLPVGRALGELVERTLAGAGHAARIDALRDPADGGAIDGWRLFHRWRERPPSDPADVTAARALDDAVDAVADLLLADSVHHLVDGKPARAAAALDALERGELATPVTAVERSSADGPMRRHRVILSITGGASWPGPVRPRAAAAPGLDAWAAAILGDPRRVVFSRDGAERSLADLGLCALDVVALLGSGGEDALLELAGAARASEAFDDLMLRAAALARLLRTARRLEPDDGIPLAPAIDRDAATVDALRALEPHAEPAAVAAALRTPSLAANPAALTAALAATLARVETGGAAAEILGGDLAAPRPVTWPPADPVVDLGAWLGDLATVRPALEPLELLTMIAPDAIGAAVRHGDTTIVGNPTGAAEALFVDGWTEAAPATETTTGAAFPFDAPRARPPQAILLAVPPPATPWSLELLEAIVDETADLARLRMIAPADVHDHLIPAAYITDDPDELTPSTDLLAISGRFTELRR